jgi:hypothetical protein
MHSLNCKLSKLRWINKQTNEEYIIQMKKLLLWKLTEKVQSIVDVTIQKNHCIGMSIRDFLKKVEFFHSTNRHNTSFCGLL